MIKPLFKLILVEPVEESTYKGLLILPENLEDKKRFGIIIDKGEEVPAAINVGDKVLWFGTKGENFEFDEKPYIIMNYDELKAVL